MSGSATCELFSAPWALKSESGGSHHIFTRERVEEIVNLQPKGGKAKPYQVKQVRQLITRYKLSGQVHEED